MMKLVKASRARDGLLGSGSAEMSEVSSKKRGQLALLRSHRGGEEMLSVRSWEDVSRIGK